MKFSNLIFIGLILFGMSGFAQQTANLNNILSYRNMYPYKVGSWITSIAVPETNDMKYSNTWYIGARNGGVWKTINNGNTYSPIFDSVGISSIGALAISKSNPEQVWIGTGEAFNSRSTHAGRGVYFSPDGGNTWQSKGLEDTQHIPIILIHPVNPKIVYVASMGHLFTPNTDRGIFKTVNGGNSWTKVFYIDKNTGIIDMIIDPQNPQILYASAYEKYRSPWHFEAGGKNSGIYKSNDGGETWNKLTNGLPKGKLGRIGLGLCYNQPNIVYAVIENLNPKPGVTINEDVAINHMRDPYYDQMVGGEVYRSDDSGESWIKRNTDSCNVSAKAPYSFNKVMVQPDNPNRITISCDAMITSLDGGQTFLDCTWPPTKYFTNMFGDIRTMWVNPENGNHMMIGSDGGLFTSYDGGINMLHQDNIPLGEIYMVEYDDADPYNIYIGIQDHDAWKGPSNDWSGRIGPEDWSIIGMWDGMYTTVDHQNNRWVYISTQFGGHRRVDQLKGKRYEIEPIAPKGEPPYRFAWTPPIVLSPHNQEIIYTAGQYLLRSLDQGRHWEKMSPDLTTNNAKKIAGKGHVMFCTITTISESPVTPGLIWVGTDDGKVHLTTDFGKNWIEMTNKLQQIGAKDDYRVTRVVASQHDIATAYVSMSGFKFDDFTPLLFMTTNFGKTWTKITDGISHAPINVITEDPTNPNLLFAGNDEGVFVSFNKAEKWESFKLNMPIVPVNDIKIQPRENDIIVGTYGRGAFLCDISLLQQLNDTIFNEDMWLFNIEPKPKRNYSEMAYWGNYEFFGDNKLFTPNEPSGITIYTWFKNRPKKESAIEIINCNNIPTDTLTLSQSAGLQKTLWHTNNVKPGKYKFRLINMDFVKEKYGIVKPTPQWSVGNSNLPYFSK